MGELSSARGLTESAFRTAGGLFEIRVSLSTYGYVEVSSFSYIRVQTEFC